MRPDTSPLRTGLALLSGALARTASVARAGAARAWRLLRSLARAARAAALTAWARTRRTVDGPVRRAVTGPVRTALLGRRADVSLLVVSLAPALALGAAWWVASTAGYAAVESWVRGTWSGTAPSLAVFLGVAALLALGAISAAVNSGLLPTGALVSAPVFGVAITRYGTEVTYSWGTQVVSLPDATAVAAGLAVAFGAPLALAGFLLGTAARRVLAVLTGGAGPPSSPERA